MVFFFVFFNYLLVKHKNIFRPILALALLCTMWSVLPANKYFFNIFLKKQLGHEFRSYSCGYKYYIFIYNSKQNFGEKYIFVTKRIAKGRSLGEAIGYTIHIHTNFRKSFDTKQPCYTSFHTPLLELWSRRWRFKNFRLFSIFFPYFKFIWCCMF